MTRRKSIPRTDPRWTRLKRDLQEFAPVALRLHDLPYADRTPSNVADGLEQVRKIADNALRSLRKLNLAHTAEQDIESKPFNWPLVQSLAQGLALRRVRLGMVGDAEPDAGYPTEVLEALASLRDAAAEALMLERPQRGNATRRTTQQAQIAGAGTVFVGFYRRIFGAMPPKSDSGPAVDAMYDFLDILQLTPGYGGGQTIPDPARVLRTAVERAQRDIDAIKKHEPE
jgi:hypothetical protein